MENEEFTRWESTRRVGKKGENKDKKLLIKGKKLF